MHRCCAFAHPVIVRGENHMYVNIVKMSEISNTTYKVAGMSESMRTRLSLKESPFKELDERNANQQSNKKKNDDSFGKSLDQQLESNDSLAEMYENKTSPSIDLSVYPNHPRPVPKRGIGDNINIKV